MWRLKVWRGLYLNLLDSKEEVKKFNVHNMMKKWRNWQFTVLDEVPGFQGDKPS